MPETMVILGGLLVIATISIMIVLTLPFPRKLQYFINLAVIIGAIGYLFFMIRK